MNNTKARSEEIQAAARALLVARGVDITQQVARPLVKALAEQTGCHIDTAKRHVAAAIRRARGEQARAWGGARPGAGRPKATA